MEKPLVVRTVRTTAQQQGQLHSQTSTMDVSDCVHVSSSSSFTIERILQPDRPSRGEAPTLHRPSVWSSTWPVFYVSSPAANSYVTRESLKLWQLQLQSYTLQQIVLSVIGLSERLVCFQLGLEFGTVGDCCAVMSGVQVEVRSRRLEPRWWNFAGRRTCLPA